MRGAATKAIKVPSYCGIRSACNSQSSLALLNYIEPLLPNLLPSLRPRGRNDQNGFIAIRDASSHADHDNTDVPLERKNHAASS